MKTSRATAHDPPRAASKRTAGVLAVLVGLVVLFFGIPMVARWSAPPPHPPWAAYAAVGDVWVRQASLDAACLQKDLEIRLTLRVLSDASGKRLAMARREFEMADPTDPTLTSPTRVACVPWNQEGGVR